MITRISGTLFSKSPPEITVEVGGIGYAVAISFQTYEKLPPIGQQVALFTYLHVREDALLLFGFHSETERQMFLNLISISGIGPKMGINILSSRNSEELKDMVIQGNVSGLISLPGIGRKTAERIILELRDKLSKESLSLPDGEKIDKGDIRSEALMALIALGYSRQIAERAIHKAIQTTETQIVKVEELIKSALKQALG